MLNLMRNVCVAQSICGKSMTGILSNRIGEVFSSRKSSYSTRLKGRSEEPNPNLNPNETHDKSSQKKYASPKITLISKDAPLIVMTLEEAQRMSKRRDLKLVKIVDVDQKTKRPVYKMMTGAEYFEEDLIRRKEKSARKNEGMKEPKLLTLSSKINDHDLNAKIKNITKWLNKRHEVRIVINAGENMEEAENICSTIEAEIKNYGNMVQKRQKGDELKFQLVTSKKKNADSTQKNVNTSDAVTSKTES